MHDIFFSSRHKSSFLLRPVAGIEFKQFSVYIYICIYADKETPTTMGDFYVLVTWKEIQHVLWGGPPFFSEYWCDFEENNKFQSLSIHGTGIFTYIWLIFMVFM